MILTTMGGGERSADAEWHTRTAGGVGYFQALKTMKCIIANIGKVYIGGVLIALCCFFSYFVVDTNPYEPQQRFELITSFDLGQDVEILYRFDEHFMSFERRIYLFGIPPQRFDLLWKKCVDTGGEVVDVESLHFGNENEYAEFKIGGKSACLITYSSDNLYWDIIVGDNKLYFSIAT